MSSLPWYECVAASVPVTHLISSCPLVAWKNRPLQLQLGREEECLRSALTVVRADVVVLTQACDLEHEKVSNVILCPHVGVGEYRAYWEEGMRSVQQNPTQRAWRSHCDDIREGVVWNLAMLNAGDADGTMTDHRIADFHEVFSVPREFLEWLLQTRGRPRLRVLPPYREHLSQAFARFFMRVGLPVPVEEIP